MVKRGRLSRVKWIQMGSFSSKARAIRSGSQNFGDSPKEEINSGSEDESRSITDASEIAENSTTQEQAEVTNGGGSSSGATSHQQHTTPRVHQSFSCLGSPPIVFNATANVQKGKGKSFIEGGSRSSSVMIYSNGKYLKSWQHSTELLPSETTERKPKRDAGSSSTSTADNNGNFAANDDRDNIRNKEQIVNQVRPGRGNIGHFLSSRAGFGLLPEQNS